MNKYQARLLISIAISVVMVLAGTSMSVELWGLHWGFVGFIASAFAALMVVFLFNLVAFFYDDLGDRDEPNRSC